MGTLFEGMRMVGGNRGNIAPLTEDFQSGLCSTSSSMPATPSPRNGYQTNYGDYTTPSLRGGYHTIYGNYADGSGQLQQSVVTPYFTPIIVPGLEGFTFAQQVPPPPQWF